MGKDPVKLLSTILAVRYLEQSQVSKIYRSVSRRMEAMIRAYGTLCQRRPPPDVEFVEEEVTDEKDDVEAVLKEVYEE